MSDKREPHRGVVVKTGAADATVQLERLISKQKYKDAVKQAKLIHKAEGTPQSHRQLENAYFLRAQQLLRSGMPDSAVEVSRHLLDFGVTDAKLVEEFSPLLVKLGLAQEAFRLQGRSESPESQNRLLLLAADQAVLHPERSQRSAPEFQEAALVRQALEALHAGDEANALGLVRDIARSSPVSDWKLLVRGLAAFYKGDHAEAQANWSRLDPTRAPMRIARHLQELQQGRAGQDSVGGDFDELEVLVYGERILPRLQELSGLLGKRRWVDVVRRIIPLRHSLRAVDPRLAEKLTSCLLAPLIDHAITLDYTSGTRLVREFTQVAEPLAIDPGWNRFWAVIWERFRDGASDAIKYWTKYVADLENCTALQGEERPLAQALVWKHLAELYLDELENRSEEDEDFDEDFDDPEFEDEYKNGLEMDEDKLMQQAATCIERSIQLAPKHRPTYDLLVEICDMSDNPEKLTKAKQRILEVFPDDVETIVELAMEKYHKDEFAPALELLSKARRHKPLDEFLVNQEFMVRTSLARALALEKRWDEGRAQFAACEQLLPGESRVFSYLAKKAVFETKAGQRDLADRYEREAAALLPELAPLWLAFRVESIRYHLTKATQKQYAEVWKKELTKKCRSETAGAMASFLTSFLALEIDYAGRDRDATELLKYVRRTSRLNYRLEDLENVCEFLGYFPQESELTRKLVDRGLKTNPESAILHIVKAGVALSSPIAICDQDVRHHLQEALRLAEASTRRREILLVPKIKEMLSVHSELNSRIAGFPFGPPGSFPVPGGKPGSLDDFLGAFLGAFDEDGDDDEEEDSGGPRPFFGRKFAASHRPNRGSGRGTRSGS